MIVFSIIYTLFSYTYTVFWNTDMNVLTYMAAITIDCFRIMQKNLKKQSNHTNGMSLSLTALHCFQAAFDCFSEYLCTTQVLP